VPIRPLILQLLRAETRPAHEALEQTPFNQALAAGTPSAEATAYFLAKMYGFLVPYEARLRQHPFGPEWEIERRQRAHLILEDLGLAPAALPLCPALPPLDSWPQLLGAMYVLEGSTLGGQVIARQLAQAGIPLRTYFTGAGDQTGPLWKSFSQLLDEAATNDNATELVQSATLTFEHLHTWLNQS
jgi:heme oxygenase